MKKLAIILAILCSSAFSQTTLRQTTLSAAVNANPALQNFVQLASNTGVSTPDTSGSGSIQTVLYIDAELMNVVSIAPITGVITVQRGVSGTQTNAHSSGATVFVGTPNQFYTYNPSGACVASQTLVTPWINVLNGTQWLCTGGNWTISSNPSGGGGTGSGASLPALPCIANQLFTVTGAGGNGDTTFYCGGPGDANRWLRISAFAMGDQLSYGGQRIVQAVDYGIVPDYSVTDATVTNGSNIVTCPNADCGWPSSCTVGMLIQGGTSTNGAVLPTTTISSCDSSTQIHTVLNATVTPVAATTFLVWGKDNTALLTSAWLATGDKCQYLALSPGFYFTTTAQFNHSNGCVGGGLLGTAGGWLTTSIVPTYNFSYTAGGPSGSGCNGGISNNACFFGVGNQTIQSIDIHGMFSGTNPGTFLNQVENNGGYFDRVQVSWWCEGCLNTEGMHWAGVQPINYESAVVNSANRACVNDGNGTVSLITPCLIQAGSMQYALVVSTGSMLSMGNFYQGGTQASDFVSAGASIIHINDTITGGAVINAGEETFEHTKINTSTFTNNSGGTIKFINSDFSSKAMTNNAGASMLDQCGNINYGVITNSGTYRGDGCPGTVITAAKLVLSAGWGSTAAWTALTGFSNFVGTITASGVGQAANPTITYTFPVAFPVASQNCQATILKSNDAGVTISNYALTPSALSKTGVTWTYTGTPVAGDTYTVQGTCTN